MSQRLAIFDIDGCCLNLEARLPHFDTDYELFQSLWHTDKPIPQGVLVYRLLMKDSTLKPVFLTSRNEDLRDVTAHQLRLMFPKQEYELWMRPSDNKMPCQEYKVLALQSHGYQPSDVFIAFDDHSEVIAAYRKLGIVAYHTADREE